MAVDLKCKALGRRAAEAHDHFGLVLSSHTAELISSCCPVGPNDKCHPEQRRRLRCCSALDC